MEKWASLNSAGLGIPWWSSGLRALTAKGLGSSLGRGTEIAQAVQRCQNKKQKICSADQQERAVWGCSTHAEFFFSHGNVSLAVSPQLCQGIVDELKLYVFEVYSVMVCYMGTL